MNVSMIVVLVTDDFFRGYGRTNRVMFFVSWGHRI